MFSGILLKESLANEKALELLDITKVEKWDVANASSEQPSQWTAIYYTGDDTRSHKIAEQLSDSLKEGQWYTNFTTATGGVFVVFPHKVFEYQKGDIERRQKAIEYGRSINIPESQLDWEE